MQLFQSGLARAALANQQGWAPNTDVFNNVKSAAGTQLFTQTVRDNYEGQLELAKQAMREYGGAVRQDMVNETSLDLERMRTDARQKENKRNALIKMLSGSPSAVNRSGGGVLTDSQVLNMAFGGLGGSPLDNAIDMGKKFQTVEGMVNTDMAEITGAFNAGMKKTVPMGRSMEGLKAPAGQSASSTQLQTRPLSSVQLSEEDLGTLLKEFDLYKSSGEGGTEQ